MKILDLFNEYNLSPEMTGGEVEQPRTEKDRNTMSRIYKAYIVSKDFGWIKWLVDNDKINISNYEYEIGAARIGENNIDEWRDEYSDYEKTLMLLSIQDEPIEFLISVLK